MNILWSETLAQIGQNQLLMILLTYVVVLILVALGLALMTLRLHQSNEEKAQRWRDLEERWEPPLMKVLAGDDWPDSLLKDIKEGEQLFFIDFLMRYAEKLNGEPLKTVQKLAEPYLESIANRVIHGDAEQRSRAVLTLSTLAPERFSDKIKLALDDESPLVAMLAARSMAEQGRAGATPIILSKIERFRTWNQSYVISLLVSLSRENPEELRDELVKQEHDAWVKVVIIQSLGELNDWHSLPLCVDLLSQESDREVQAAALQVIGKLGHDGLKGIVRSKCHDKDFVIRLNAIKALSLLGDESDREILRAAIDDESQWIATQAAYGLKRSQNFAILKDLSESEHPRKELAAQVLYDYHSDSAVRYLSQQLEFVPHVEEWLHLLQHRNLTEDWKLLEEILISGKTHAEVAGKIVQGLDEKTPDQLFEVIHSHVLAGREHPAYLYQAMYRINRDKSLKVLQDLFFARRNWSERWKILAALSHYPAYRLKNFIDTNRFMLDKELRTPPSDLPESALKALQALVWGASQPAPKTI